MTKPYPKPHPRYQSVSHTSLGYQKTSACSESFQNYIDPVAHEVINDPIRAECAEGYAQMPTCPMQGINQEIHGRMVQTIQRGKSCFSSSIMIILLVPQLNQSSPEPPPPLTTVAALVKLLKAAAIGLPLLLLPALPSYQHAVGLVDQSLLADPHLPNHLVPLPAEDKLRLSTHKVVLGNVRSGV